MIISRLLHQVTPTLRWKGSKAILPTKNRHNKLHISPIIIHGNKREGENGRNNENDVEWITQTAPSNVGRTKGFGGSDEAIKAPLTVANHRPEKASASFTRKAFAGNNNLSYGAKASDKQQNWLFPVTRRSAIAENGENRNPIDS
jgi:hypothetical protein